MSLKCGERSDRGVETDTANSARVTNEQMLNHQTLPLKWRIIASMGIAPSGPTYREKNGNDCNLVCVLLNVHRCQPRNLQRQRRHRQARKKLRKKGRVTRVQGDEWHRVDMASGWAAGSGGTSELFILAHLVPELAIDSILHDYPGSATSSL